MKSTTRLKPIRAKPAPPVTVAASVQVYKGVTLPEQVEAVFRLPKLTRDAVKGLSDGGLRLLVEEFNRRRALLSGIELDTFVEWADILWTADDRSVIWENNHNNICRAISSLSAEYGAMPPATAIAKKAGLHRKTVHKHLKEFGNHPLFVEKREKFKMLHERVLTQMYRIALNDGNVKAARLFLEATGGLPNAQSIGTQNNYVQINGLTLDQKTVKLLSAGALEQIRRIVETELPANNESA